MLVAKTSNTCDFSLYGSGFSLSAVIFHFSLFIFHFSLKEMNKTATTILLGAGLLLASCADLSLAPKSENSDSSIPQNDADAIALVTPPYATNTLLSTKYSYMSDLVTETTVSGENPNGGGGMLGLLKWDGTNSYITSMWQSSYQSIAQANDAIEKVEASSNVSEAVRKRVVGEAKFLRAYYYFYLVQFFGPVPLVLTTDGGQNTVRTPEHDVYAQIAKDLGEAAEDLPEKSAQATTDIGRATRGAALAALAKTYLVWAQNDDSLTDSQRHGFYSLAVDNAQKVIDSGEYRLEEDFHANWDNQNRNGKESIFATQHYTGSSLQGDNTGGNHLVHCCFSTGFSVSLPHVTPTPTREVEDSYLPGDQRRDVSFADSLWRERDGGYFHFYYDADGDGIRESGFSRYKKYIDLDNPENSSSARAMNRTILRYAEVLLIKAEAINERDHGANADAFAAINQVRRRAFREDITSTAAQPHDLTVSDYEAFREAVMQERSWEFVYEQKHWFDLKRWKVLVKTIRNSRLAREYPEYNKAAIDFRNYRYPIPQSQRDINPNLWQNYGYDGSTIKSNPYKNAE